MPGAAPVSSMLTPGTPISLVPVPLDNAMSVLVSRSGFGASRVAVAHLFLSPKIRQDSYAVQWFAPCLTRHHDLVCPRRIVPQGGWRPLAARLHWRLIAMRCVGLTQSVDEL